MSDDKIKHAQDPNTLNNETDLTSEQLKIAETETYFKDIKSCSGVQNVMILDYDG